MRPYFMVTARAGVTVCAVMCGLAVHNGEPLSVAIAWGLGTALVVAFCARMERE